MSMNSNKRAQTYPWVVILKILFLNGLMGLLFVPGACQKNYLVSPKPLFTPTFTITATFTPTSTPTIVGTPGCGFAGVTVVTPITPYLTPTPVPTLSMSATPTPIGTPPLSFPQLGGSTYVIHNLAEWQTYYGSTSAPPPPVDFNTQMIIINLQEALVSPGTVSFAPEIITVQNVCWTTSQITISCSVFLPCEEGFPIEPVVPILIGTPTPEPTPTPIPPTWEYYPTAIVVPLSSLPVQWSITTFTFGPCAG